MHFKLRNYAVCSWKGRTCPDVSSFNNAFFGFEWSGDLSPDVIRCLLFRVGFVLILDIINYNNYAQCAYIRLIFIFCQIPGINLSNVYKFPKFQISKIQS